MEHIELRASCFQYDLNNVRLFSRRILFHSENSFCSQVLVVQEKNGKFRGSGLWKYPTGVINEVSALKILLLNLFVPLKT